MDSAEDEILALERDALARWCRGDPSGFLEISAPDVAYFDPFVAQRLDGLEALTRYYESLRGRISASRWEIVAPRVQRVGDVAVLTFQFLSWDDARTRCAGTARRFTASRRDAGRSSRPTGP